MVFFLALPAIVQLVKLAVIGVIAIVAIILVVWIVKKATAKNDTPQQSSFTNRMIKFNGYKPRASSLIPEQPESFPPIWT